MIITVTMNPAIDKTADLDQFVYRGLNRLKDVIVDAGGKGINVSKTIKALGGESIASGFCGKDDKLIENMLNNENIKNDFVKIDGSVRTNLKVVEKGGILTELNEPGPEIKIEELNELTEKLERYAGRDTLFVLAGSIPRGIDKTVYKDMILKLEKKGAQVFLDADGELFVNAVEAAPTIIKPNKFELEQYYGCTAEAGEDELIKMGMDLLDKGIKLVAVSLGQDGALFLTQNEKLKCPGLKVDAHSTVGAGDAMVAALAYGIDKNMDLKECVRLGIAASAGAVTTQGTKPPADELVQKLKDKVSIIEI
ncbi:MAG: 1-phosphofructokinase [Clostridium sp.]|nr:1-phosphofructokinase [Clostridium sp.]